MLPNVLEKPEVVDDAVRAASKIRSIVSDAAEDGVRSARKAMKQGRYAAEDAIQEAERTVKQRPFVSVGVGFATGVLVGGLLAWVGFRRR